MVSTIRARLRGILGEHIVVSGEDPLARIRGALRFSDESDALRFLGTIASNEEGKQSLGQLFYHVDIGGALEFNEDEVMKALAKQLAWGHLCAVPVAVIDEAEAKPESLGINPVHAARLRKFCAREGYLLILRAGNVESLRYHDRAGHVSKSKDIKLKTAPKEAGDRYGGLVTRPMKMTAEKKPIIGPDGKPVFKSVMEWTDDERDNIRKAFEKDYDFDRDGVLRDKDGNAVHGDYDVQGVYRSTGDGYYDQIPVDADLLARLNREVCPEREMFRHGANDDGAGFSEAGPGSNEEGNVMDYVTMPDGRVQMLMWRQTEAKERFLAFHPTGETTAFGSLWELKTFLEARGLTWLYTF